MRPQLAMIVKVDGTTEPMWFTDDKSFMAAAQTAVGGYVEHITMGEGRSMWCDEDGKSHGHPINHWASRMFRMVYPLVEDFIVGNVVLTEGFTKNGSVRGLNTDNIPGPVFRRITGG